MSAARSLLVVGVGLALAAAAAVGADGPAGAAPRVVSLGPSLTATLLALDARETLVGVDDESARLEPSVRGLPRVGGLFNPSLEAIVALAPSFVAAVPSAQQRELRQRLEALGVELLALPNIRYAEVLRAIEVLGARVGRGDAARERAAAIRAAWRAARARSAGRPALRSVWVLQRDPLFVVGGGSFLDEMLDAAGAHNLAGDFAEPYPRVSDEWLIAAAPELILDASDRPDEAQAHWARWPSLPAVARDRIRVLEPALTLPGPYLDRSLAELVRVIEEVGAR